MIITYFGGGSFRLQSGDVSVLIDPQNNRLKADVTLDTLTPASAPAEGENRISYPGEYEVKGIEIRGMGVPEESNEKFLKTVYNVRFEDVNFVFLGHLSKMPDVKLMEHIGEPDVLIIPTGAEHFLPAETAAKIVKQLEAPLVIPSFHKNLAEFLKLLGQKGDTEEKLVFKKKDLENPRLVILEAKG